MVVVGALALYSSSAFATTYIVEPGDTLGGIAQKLGFKSIKAAGIESVPSGDFNKIFIGDEIKYVALKKKKRFVQRKANVDLNKFCFEDNRSIHYKAEERCRPDRFDAKKKIIKKKKRKPTSDSH